MLITMGVYSTPMSRQIQRMRAEGFSIKKIAMELGVSVGTVSSNLSYEDEIHGNDDVSEHAAAMREYRAYERMQKKRTEGLKEEKRESSWKDEWKDEVKMSFKETSTRPPRMTWDDAEKMRQQILRIHPEFDESIIGDREEYEDEADMLAEYEELKAALEKQRNLHKGSNSDDKCDPDDLERLDELAHKLGRFEGALYSRDLRELEKVSGEQIPFTPGAVVCLHLEIYRTPRLYDGQDRENEAVRIIRKYGNLKGKTISRDVVVPADLPLYALHFLIQRLFG